MQQHITEQTRLLSSHKSNKDYYDNDTHHQLQQQQPQQQLQQQQQPQQQLQKQPLINRNIPSIQPVPLSRGTSSSSSTTTTTSYNYDTLAKDNAVYKYNESDMKSNISVDEFAIYHDLNNHPMSSNSIYMSDGYLHDSNNNPSTKAVRTGRQRKKTASRTKGTSRT